MKMTLQWIFVSALVFYIVDTFRMTHYMKDVGGTETMPDLKFGFTAESLRELRREAWGEKGCQVYVNAAALDLFPYMESYIVIFWCLATIVCRNSSTQRKNLAKLMATVPFSFDVVETLILRQTCLSSVSDEWRISSSGLVSGCSLPYFFHYGFGVAAETGTPSS